MRSRTLWRAANTPIRSSALGAWRQAARTSRDQVERFPLHAPVTSSDVPNHLLGMLRRVGPKHVAVFGWCASVERTGGGKDRCSAHLELGREAKGPQSHPAVAAGSWYTWAEFPRITRSA